jgi:hypothetical protein
VLRLPLEAKIIGVLVLLAGLLGAVYAWDAHQQALGALKVEAQRQAENAARATVAASAAMDAQAETTRRFQAQQGIAHDAQLQTGRARADAASAARAADGLRQQLAAFAAAGRGTCGDPGAAPGSPAASAPIDVLADLFRGPDDAAGELAAALDLSHAAGVACERSGDSLTPAPPKPP